MPVESDGCHETDADDDRKSDPSWSGMVIIATFPVPFPFPSSFRFADAVSESEQSVPCRCQVEFFS